jgi:hypothetical protein
MDTTKEVKFFSLGASAYALALGIRLIRTTQDKNTGRFMFYVDDTNGAASACLDEWRTGDALVPGRLLMQRRAELLADIKAGQ